MANYGDQDHVHVMQIQQDIHESNDVHNSVKEQVVTSGSQESINSGSSSYEHDTELRYVIKQINQVSIVAFLSVLSVY